MYKNWHIILGGTGGQGLGKGGQLLAEAAIKQGYNAAQSQNYGAEARGGLSQSDIIIARGEIIYPLIEKADIILALSQKAFDLNAHRLAGGGMLLVDPGLVKDRGAWQIHPYPMLQEARRLNFERGLTMLGLGLLIGLTGIIRPDYMEGAIANNFSGRAAEMNTLCFRQGLSMAASERPHTADIN